MSNVKRYMMDENSLMGGMDMFEDDEGEYVLYSDYSAILTRHNALVEAAAWERECDVCGHWLHLEFWANDDKGVDLEEIADIEAFARAEVDRLIGEYST